MDNRLERLYDFALRDLTENLLPWWIDKGIDDRYGGWYGAVTNDGEPVEGHDKFIVLFSRLVWTFSSAYRVLKKEEYRSCAERAYEFLIAHFYDKENGGFFNRVDYKGDVLDSGKYTYGNAFSIYALSEYYRACGDKRALELAIETRDKLEKYIYDPVCKGYFETFTADWKITPWVKGVNRDPGDKKTMNTHLHVLEAFTCLARVDHSDKTRSLLRRQLYIMLNKVVDHDIHHYYYYQARDWSPTSNAISFGHDVEGSWLMLEAAEVLGEEAALRDTKDVCMNIAAACLEEGQREDGAMMTEYDPVTQTWSKNISWWEQAEQVVGFVNAWQNTGEDRFLSAACRGLDFIESHMIDREKGGWLLVLNGETLMPVSKNKQDGYLCPYHNSRMSMELIERIGPMHK